MVSSGTGTRAAALVLTAATVPGGANAHTRTEESIVNFTLRLLDGECSGSCVGCQLWGARPQDGSSQDPWGLAISTQHFLPGGPSARAHHEKVALTAGPPLPVSWMV